MAMHADPESLLLLALAAPVAPELQDWLGSHLLGCAECAERLDGLLAAREGEADEVEPLRAAASAVRAWDAPAPLAPSGTLGGVAVYRLPGESPRFAVDEVGWIGKTLRLTIPGEEPVVAQVDEFRRLRVADGAARLAAALARGAEVGVEIVEP